MKKLTCTFMALLLLCLCTVAYAADPLLYDPADASALFRLDA